MNAASKILIPVDGSAASLRALDYAIKMAAQIPGLSFVLLNVQNVSATELSGEFMEGVQERLLQAADKAETTGSHHDVFNARLTGANRGDHCTSGSHSGHALGLGRHEGHPPGRSSDHPTQVAAQNPTRPPGGPAPSGSPAA